MVEFTEAQIADLEAMAVEGFAYVRENANEEHKAALDARISAMKASTESAEAEKARVMAEMTEDFSSCDLDADGYLNEAEYLAFGNKMNVRKAAKGLFCDTREATATEYYRICKASMPDAPGIDMAVMFKTIGVIGKKSMELKVAAE